MDTFGVPVYSQIVCAQPRIYTIQLYFKLIYMQTHLTIQPHIFCILMFIPRSFIFTVLSITFYLLSILISLGYFLL